ncbi:MAG: response regulator [Acidobacteria bacterium]|nr:response regulator [Acidobacteriota bacterium]
MKVLIAEDDEPSRVLLSEYFQASGWDVVTAVDGAEAVLLAKQTHPDVAILDIRMPRMDGFQALEGMRKDLETALVPAIAVTAFVSKAEQARGLAAGFQAYLPKPVDLWGLVERAACLASHSS